MAHSRENGASERSPLLGDDEEPAPIPKTQVVLLCFARVVEPIAFFSVFPYINQMVQDNGAVADADVGFYSGLIESLFSLTQAFVMLAWGRAADRWGRKPVLVVSLVGMASATALFGLARSLGQMIAFRCLAGVFAGTIVTIRTMLAEHSTPTTQARVFSWFAFGGNLGIFFGPLLGGALADPLRAHGGEKEGRFLAVYPYALPGFVVSSLGMLAAVLCALFVEETLVRPKLRSSGEDFEDHTPIEDNDNAVDSDTSVDSNTTYTIWQLLQAPGVGIVLYVYAHVMLLAFSYTALAPVFWFTPVRLGGLGFSPLQISLLMGVQGAAQALWLLLAFPPLQRRLGTRGVMRLCAAAYPLFMAVSPLTGLLRRGGWGGGSDRGPSGAGDVVFWLFLGAMLAIGSGVSMCFTAIQLAVNNVAPAPHLLGTLNALALTGVSAIRAVTPALFTSLFAVGARTQWFGGYAIWVLMIVLALGYTVAARYLPDDEVVKKQRLTQRWTGTAEPRDPVSGPCQGLTATLLPTDSARHQD